MEIPIQPILFSIPSLVYIVVRKIQHHAWKDIFSKLGWRLPPLKYVGIGLGMGLVPGLLTLFLPNLFPADLLDQEQIAQTVYSTWDLSIATFFLIFAREAIYTALGEEVFFRGFLGGMLFRKFGFAVGNIIQAILFLLPHLILLVLSLKLWPLLVVQLLGGWLYGWLYHESNSILPGWLSHSLGNAFGALMFMR